jgi:predicted dehydrogenase
VTTNSEVATVSEAPIKIIQVGAGSMGRAWLRNLVNSPDVELVGLVDLDVELAGKAAEETGHPGLPVATSLFELGVGDGFLADAVVNVTIPGAHAATSEQALFAGLPVLCEKPIAPTVATGLGMVAAAEAADQLLMISQSRRYFTGFDQLRALTGELGALGSVSVEFFKAPHFGGFRDAMDHPLLVDMAIHTFDAARALLGSNPVSVYCEAYNPSWSWYAGDAAANAIFEFEDGVRVSYDGSWCAPGQETSWNGRWRISGEHGTAGWDGDGEATIDRVDGAGSKITEASEQPEQIAGSLADFVRCLRTGASPQTVAAANVLSLAMVEAAVTSAARQERVRIADVITSAYDQAIAQDHPQPIQRVLNSWDVLSVVGLR